MTRDRATSTQEDAPDKPAGKDSEVAGAGPAAPTSGDQHGQEERPSEAPPEAPLPEPRREQLNALEIRAVTNELQSIVGAYVEKAYQPTRDELLLRLRKPGTGRIDLYARRGALLLIATNPPPNPTHPSSFAMAIRRNASGGKVYEVEQAGFDRVVTLHVQRRSGDHKIVLELFGDGNILLVREDGRILLPLVHEAWKTRVLRPGAPYEPPPARDDPTTFDEATFLERMRNGNRDLVRALAREVGLGGPVAEEVIARAQVDKKLLVEDADDKTLKQAYEAWDALRDEIQKGPRAGHLLIEEGRVVECAPYESVLMQQEVTQDPERYEMSKTESFSAALDKLYLEARRGAQAKEESKRVDTVKTKLETQENAQNEAIEKFTRQETEGKLHGDLLFAHYQLVEAILNGIMNARKEHDWATIQKRIEQGKKAGNEQAAHVVLLEPGQGRLVLRLEDAEGQDHQVPLDITKSVTENAQKAYDRSKTARSKLKGARAALEETRKKLEAATRDAQVAAQEAREISVRPTYLIPPERHHWFEGYRWMYASTGELIVGGRDASSNDRLVKKHLAENDRYVHADIHGAPSTLVKPAPGTDPVSEKALEEGGRFAVVYSRAFAQAGSADAYWATPTQVSKTPEAGEFLARGAFIVRGKRNWIRKLPMELGVGRVWLDADGRPAPAPQDPDAPGGLRAKLMAGAPDAVAMHADRYIVVGPGNMDRRQATKKIARAFNAHPDPVERLLPTGSLQILRNQGVHLVEEDPEARG